MHVKPCDDWFEDVSAYVDGECDALISAAVEAHLETCARCAATAETMSTIRRRLLLTPAVAHPRLVAAVLGAAPEVGTAAPARSVGGSARRQWPVRGIVAGLAAAALLFVALLGGSALVNTDDVGRVAATVMAKPDAFGASEVQIAAGDTISWRNNSGVNHHLEVVTPGGDVSGGLDSGDHIEVTFDEPGRYDYICTIHSAMSGEVLVTG